MEGGQWRPNEEECLKLLREYGTPERVIRHSEAVWKVAKRIALALVQKGYHLEIDVICAAALLHDIARQSDDHASAGAQYVLELGLDPKISAAIATHMELPQTEEMTEAAIVYLADKLVEEDQEVSLAERFEPRIQKAAPEIQVFIQNRYEMAKQLQKRIEMALNGG